MVEERTDPLRNESQPKSVGQTVIEVLVPDGATVSLAQGVVDYQNNSVYHKREVAGTVVYRHIVVL